MRVKGSVTKDGKWWIIEFPLVNAMTQDRTRKEALAMSADWVESDINRDDFRVTVSYEAMKAVAWLALPATMIKPSWP